MALGGALRSLAARAYGVTFLVIAAGLGGYALLQVRREERFHRDLVVASSEAMARAATGPLARDLILEDYASLDALLLRVAPAPGVLRLQVCEPGGMVLADVRRTPGGPAASPRPDPPRLDPPPGDLPLAEEALGGDELVVWEPIAAGHSLGWLRATLDLRPMRAEAKAQASWAAGLASVLIAACLALLWLALRGPLHATLRLAAFARDLDRRKGEQVSAARQVTELVQLEEALNKASGELARSEQRLREERERLFLTLASLGEAIFTTDLDGRVGLLNRSAEQLVGRTTEEVAGRPLADLFPGTPEEPGAGARLQALAARPDPGAETTLRIAGADGGTRTLGVVAAPLLGAAGETRGAVVVVRDLTDRERAAEERRSLEAQLLQAQKMEALGHLAGGVAHDFNNILTAITGYASIALEGAPPGAPVREDLEQIMRAADRATGMTRSLLAFGRKQPIEPVPVDLNDVVRDLEKILRRLVSEQVDLRLHLEQGPLVTVADAGQLGQVLVNLVANARDAMPRGGRLTVATGRQDAPPPAAWAGRAAPACAVWFSVTDTGTGMDAETARHAFEPFFTTKPKGKGTGLGLPIVHGIATQHGGAVELESRPGAGTRIRVLLPAAAGPLAQAHPRERTGGPRGHGTILLVEDDALVSDVLRRTLESAGYRVVTAPDGRQGLEALGARPGEIELVISDVVMPGMTGVELAVEVRRRHASLPMLLVSGYTGEALEANGGPPPGVELLQKPLSPRLLLTKVQALLDRGAPRGA